MIKIQEQAGLSDAELDAMASTHFNLLNPIVQGKFGHYALFNRIARKMAELEAYNWQHTDLMEFLEFLNQGEGAFLRELITARPPELAAIRNEIADLFGRHFFFNETAQGPRPTFAGAVTKELFNYSNYRKKPACANRATALGYVKRACPYCNQTMVRVPKLEKNSSAERIASALLDIDHFVPQVRCPYLALSFFNLIPSCHPCNSNLKGKLDFRHTSHVHPFERSFDDCFVFVFDGPVLDPNYVPNITCRPRPGMSFATNSIDDFQLINRYLDDLTQLQRGLRYLKSQSCKIAASASTSITGAPGWIAPPELLAFGKIPQHKEQINDYPLGKLKRDVCIDLGFVL